jgi:hypothetical protein
MKFVCRRCDHVTTQTPYRVTTEEGGIVLLNILVCASCARLARSLGLPVVKMAVANKPAKTKRVKSMIGKKRQLVQAPPSTR